MSAFEIQLDFRRFERAVDQFEDALDTQMLLAMQLAVDLVVSEARSRAPQGDTSVLKNSIQRGIVQGKFTTGTLEGHVGVGAPYASYVEDGTRPHEIRPRHRRALRWPVGGGFRFARRVKHPGTKPQPFIEPAIQASESNMERIFDQAISLSARRAGFR